MQIPGEVVRPDGVHRAGRRSRRHRSGAARRRSAVRRAAAGRAGQAARARQERAGRPRRAVTSIITGRRRPRARASVRYRVPQARAHPRLGYAIQRSIASVAVNHRGQLSARVTRGTRGTRRPHLRRWCAPRAVPERSSRAGHPRAATPVAAVPLKTRRARRRATSPGRAPRGSTTSSTTEPRPALINTALGSAPSPRAKRPRGRRGENREHDPLRPDHETGKRAHRTHARNLEWSSARPVRETPATSIPSAASPRATAPPTSPCRPPARAGAGDQRDVPRCPSVLTLGTGGSMICCWNASTRRHPLDDRRAKRLGYARQQDRPVEFRGREPRIHPGAGAVDPAHAAHRHRTRRPAETDIGVGPGGSATVTSVCGAPRNSSAGRRAQERDDLGVGAGADDDGTRRRVRTRRQSTVHATVG